MPNQRAANQTLVAVSLDNVLLASVEIARKAEGRDRSTFIRIAMIEKLNKMGFDLPLSLAFSTDRTEPSAALNDKINSSKAKAVEGVARDVKYKFRRKSSSV